MRWSHLVLVAGLSSGVAAARAQAVEAPDDDAPAAPEVPLPGEPAPAPASEPAPAPVFEPPPLPPADADFSADRGLFREVDTGPEKERDAELEAALRRPASEAPLYEKQPALFWISRSTAGVFGAGTIGLLGGSIGNAIDGPDEHAPLGGFHGPAIGAGVGSIAGVGLAVWGAGQLFERPGGPEWALLGSTAGALVGGAAATGLAMGLERSDATASLAVATFVAFEVGGAILFDQLLGGK
jgi:hypothetical protein